MSKMRLSKPGYILAALLVLSISGCAGMREKDYSSQGASLLVLATSPGASMRGKNYSSKGAYYFGEKDYTKAIEYLEKAQEQDPNNAGDVTMLGWAYFLRGDYDQAISTFERLAEIDPKAVDAYTGKGWSNFKKLNCDQAIVHFNEALEIDPDSADAYGGLGWSNAKKGDTVAAEEYFNIALRKGMKYDKDNPAKKADPEAHRGLGYLNFGRGDYKAALSHFKIATRLKPDWSDARIKWGDCLFTLEKYKSAIVVYKHALKYGRTAQIYDKIGWSYSRLAEKAKPSSSVRGTRYKAAREMFDKALAIYPNYPSSLSGLAEIGAGESALEEIKTEEPATEEAEAEEPALEEETEAESQAWVK